MSVPENVSDPIIIRIIEYVADSIGRDVEDLAPLYDSIDPDALTTILQAENVSVSFEYDGVDVHVWSDGTMCVSEGRVRVDC